MTEINGPEIGVTGIGGPGSDGGVVAEVADGDLHVVLTSAPPTTLHGRYLWRTDGNSPLRLRAGAATVLFSGYEPRGHTLRRTGSPELRFDTPPLPVIILDDPDPAVGKWIEATWQAPGGPLIGWCHVEEPAPGASGLMLPRIDWLTSWDDGLVWRWQGTVLRLPPAEACPDWRNGFFAGGFGDLCVVPGGEGPGDGGPGLEDRWLYLFCSSYHPAEPLQGIAVLRLSAADPGARPDFWTPAGWAPAGAAALRPLWPVRRGFRHPDPDSFWGPAVHYNRSLGAWVMLLNRTAGGDRDFRQEGIYASLNRAIDDPAGWSPPLRFVVGGGWYPQVVGLSEGDGDTRAGATGRFFMAGFSAWRIAFAAARPGRIIDRPLACTGADFARLFGADRRCPW